MEEMMVITPSEFIKYGRWNRRRGLVIGFMCCFTIEMLFSEIIRQNKRKNSKKSQDLHAI